MDSPRLKSVRWLKNHRVEVRYAMSRGGMVRRFEGPRGRLSIAEAARALKTYVMMLYRLRDRGRLRLTQAFGVTMVPMGEVLRLRRDWPLRRRRQLSDGL